LSTITGTMPPVADPATTTTAPVASTPPPAGATDPATDPTTTSATVTQSTTKAKKADDNGMGLDKDAFLKILVEQLRHQDPSQPGDSQQYIQQMTQYSMLEQLNNISSAVQGQKVDAANTTALNLVGHTVTWKDDDGDHSGVVDKVNFTKDGATITVGSTSGIELGAVTEVR
jgi:flagellar basal-body rod modification protein FlgD